MNTVLFTSSPESSQASRIKPSRQTSDNTGTDNDALGFAGVLANQGTPWTHNTVSAASDTSIPSGPVARVTTSAESDANNASQQPLPNRVSSDEHANPDAQQGLQNGAQLTPGKPVRTPDPSVLVLSPESNNAAPSNKDSGETTLPQRFAQIIAALEETGGRRSGLPLEHDVRATRTQTSTTPASGSDVGELRTRLAASVDRLASTERSTLSGNVDTRRADLNDPNRTSLPDGRHIGGQSTFDVSIALNDRSESLGLWADSRSGQTLHSAMATADSLLNPAAAGSGFSVIPSAAQGSDALTASATVAQPLFSKHWAPELSRQFVSLIRPGENGQHVADIRLDPPELGPLRITININDSVVQAMFTSAHANVRSAIEQALPQLQQQLEQEGLSLGQASVGHDDSPPQDQSARSNVSTLGGGNESEVSTSSAPVRPRVSDALVDTFA